MTKNAPVVRDANKCPKLQQIVQCGKLSGCKTFAESNVSAQEIADRVAALGPLPSRDIAGGLRDPSDPNCMLIPLTRGAYARIDADDYSLICGYSWHQSSYGYAMARRTYAGKYIAICMHRLILMVGQRSRVDHINGDGSDSRKANLRLCSPAENTWNSALSKRNTSGFKGVHRCRNGWRGRVEADGALFQKQFPTKEQAHAWVCAKRVSLHGEFARHA